MKPLNFTTLTMIIFLLVSLVGCGGRGEVVSKTRIGQLVGGNAVSHLYYATKTHSGKVSDSGEFVYEPGEYIQFFDGSLFIGKTQAKDMIASSSLEVNQQTELLGSVDSIQTKVSH